MYVSFISQKYVSTVGHAFTLLYSFWFMHSACYTFTVWTHQNSHLYIQSLLDFVILLWFLGLSYNSSPIIILGLFTCFQTAQILLTHKYLTQNIDAFLIHGHLKEMQGPGQPTFCRSPSPKMQNFVLKTEVLKIDVRLFLDWFSQINTVLLIFIYCFTPTYFHQIFSATYTNS